MPEETYAAAKTGATGAITPERPSPAGEPPRADRPAGLPLFHISELVGAGREALITHEGQTYRLRITSNRKLILTK
jgi:hemin uptake protein HemP